MPGIDTFDISKFTFTKYGLWRLIGLNFTLTLYLLVLSADNLCKQIGTRSGLTEFWACCGSKLFDTLMVFLKDFFLKGGFLKNQQTTKT